MSPQQGLRGIPGVGFNLTDDGNYNIDGKRLTNVGEPTGDGDATTKAYFESENSKKADKTYVDSEISKVKVHSSPNYHLQQSFTFYKDYGDKAELTKSNISITNHTNHLDLLEISRQGVHDGFAYSNVKLTNNINPGTYSILFEIFGYNGTNIVTDGDSDRLLFFNIEGDPIISDFSHDWFSNYAKAYIIFNNSKRDVGITLQFRYYGSSNSNFKFLFFSRCVKGVQKTSFDHTLFDVPDVQDNHMILYFENLNLNGNLIDGLGDPVHLDSATNKKYVDTQNIRQDIAIADKANKSYMDAEIIKLPKPDTNVLKLDGSKAMTGNLKMGDHAIIGIKSSSQDNSVLTIGGAKATYLPLIGDRSMQGGLNMGGNAIKNIKPFVEDDSSQAAQNAQLNDVINFGYFHTERGELTRLINDVGYEALNRKNPDPMEDNIDMNNHRIKGLSDGNENDDAVNIKQLNEAEDNPSKYIDNKITDNNTNINSIIDQKIKESEEKSIISIEVENVFKKVMDDDLFKEDDDDIHKNGVVNKNYHKINQKTYEFKIDYDSDIGYYSTRLSIDVIYLPIGSYTMVYEMYVDDGITIDEIDAVSGTLSVGNIKSKIDGTNTRSIIPFTKNVLNSGFDDLDIDIKLKSKTDPQTTIYVVVYGITGIHSDVPIQVWDRFYYYDQDKDDINFETKIDMNNHQIIGVADGSVDKDVVNVKQLNELKTEVSKIKTDITTIITNNGLVYYTNDLKHDNEKTVKFKPFTNHPYSVNNSSEFFRISLAGFHHIIYTDFYNSEGLFYVYDNGKGRNLFGFHLNDVSDWTPITINMVIPISFDNGSNHTDLKFYITGSKKPNLDGAGYSTFFIKYLGY